MRAEYYKCYCNDIENVENYEKAEADNFQGWDCHHRLETHNSDGERRIVDITRKELITLDMYYNRPADELIFLPTKEHVCLHLKGKPSIRKGKPCSEETKKKISKANKGRIAWNKGKKMQEEFCKKCSDSHKGQVPWNKGKKCGHHSEDHKKNLSEALLKYYKENS